METKEDSKAKGRQDRDVMPQMTFEEKELVYYKTAASQTNSGGGSWPKPPYVPSRVLVTRAACSDVPGVGMAMRVMPGKHDCESNQFGAVSVEASNGRMLGLRPSEFEVIAWKKNPAA